MSSPLPPDPYAALGVSKDADLGQIRTAHRKLVLKYHPDRIKGDDSDEKVRAKNEFQKVQQAYELLADSSRRSRYDDQLKLAELQKERMMMRESSRPTAHTERSSAAPTFVRREMRSDGNYYEERAPPTSYFDSRDRFDDPLPPTSARKYEAPYDKERKPSAPKSAEKKEKFSAKMQSPVEGISMRMAFQMKAKASQAKERAKDGHAKSQEMRDRERGRERSDKHTGRRTYAVEVESESDSDTVVPKQSSRRASPRSKLEREPVRIHSSSGRRHTDGYDDESFDEGEKWERHHKNSLDYITESKQKRPAVSRNSSDAYVYWGGDSTTGRRSGSDSEKRPTSSRRTKAEDPRPRPSMPVHNSAPTNLKPYVEERIPQRAKTTPYPAERDARPMPPSLGRSQTMPTNKSSRKDTVPSKGSNLKHSETTQPDSGYYSSSNPHTPDLKGYSPPPSRENSKKKGNSTTKYQIVTPESDDERASRVTKIIDSDEEPRHRYRSPEPVKRDRERERERDRDRDRDREDRDRPRMRERPLRTESDSRTRSSRAPASASYSRSEFRGSPPVAREKLFGEISSDEKEAPRTYSYDTSRVKTASYRAPATASYGSPRFGDDAPGSVFREQMRYPNSRKQSTAY